MAKFIKVTQKGSEEGAVRSVVVNIDEIYRTAICRKGNTIIELKGKWDSGATIYRDQIADIVETSDEIHALIKEAQGEEATQQTVIAGPWPLHDGKAVYPHVSRVGDAEVVEWGPVGYERGPEERAPVDLSKLSEEEKIEKFNKFMGEWKTMESSPGESAIDDLAGLSDEQKMLALQLDAPTPGPNEAEL